MGFRHSSMPPVLPILKPGGGRPGGFAARSQSGFPHEPARGQIHSQRGARTPHHLDASPAPKAQIPHPQTGGRDTLCPPQLKRLLRHPKVSHPQRDAARRHRAVTKRLTPHLDSETATNTARGAVIVLI